MTRLLMLALMAVLPLAALGQTSRSQRPRNTRHKVQHIQQTATRPSTPCAQITPLVDYHTHIFTAAAYAHILEPLLPSINLPADLAQLLRDKERFGGKDKNPPALADLYTKDVLVLDATRPTWLRGARAIRFIVELTEIHRLLPNAYEVNGSAGYIAGTEAEVQGSAIQHISNFLYVIRKEPDGKWRISSEVFTLNGPPVPQEATAKHLIAHLDAEGIKRAVVLSTAYWYGRGAETKSTPDEYAQVRRENDWVAQQVARYPARLVGFCSFNPLKNYAIEELNRCANSGRLQKTLLHTLVESGVPGSVLNRLHPINIRRPS